MTDYPLDISPLQRAIDKLDSGLARYHQDTTDEQVRDGLIQRFEFTYELSHKMLKRYLLATTPSPDLVAEMSFQDLIRSANARDLLLGEWADWKTFRDMRSRTSHTYDEAVALAVVAGIPRFLAEARHLYKQLAQRLS